MSSARFEPPPPLGRPLVQPAQGSTEAAKLAETKILNLQVKGTYSPVISGLLMKLS